MTTPYTIVIGLEVHVQLLTASKLFCGCSTRFGAPPNTQTCPVCTGMPGSLPVMNRRAFELSLVTAVALNCTIPRQTKWDRKQYYYPDLPKGYQISQYDLPMSCDGWLEIDVGKGDSPKPPGETVGGAERSESHQPDSLQASGQNSSDPFSTDPFSTRRIGIIRAHLEEDAGKSMHDEAAGRADSRIDLNRAGTPLLEIVSQPDLRSPAEAKAFLNELKLLLNYLGVSDCNMQEGSLRVDANINLHLDGPDGKIATPIVEIKNMNSFRAVERALNYEAGRQYAEFQRTGKKLGEAPKSTRGWDDTREITYEQRSKEESSDYRYFPDPDLAPVRVSDEQLAQVRASLGELPAALRRRLETTWGLSAYDSDVLVNQGRALVDYFVATAEGCGEGKAASNWIQQDVLRWLNERGLPIEKFPVSAASLAALIRKVLAGEFPTSRGREVLAAMLDAGRSLDETIAALGIAAVDSSELENLCRRLLDANAKVVAEVKQGNHKALGALIGQAKKQNANINPNQFREMCLKLIEG